VNKPISKADKESIRARYCNKMWTVAYYLLAYDVRGDDFEYIMRGAEQVKAENRKQRQEWLAGAMERMDERLTPSMVKEMREGSACCIGGERHELARQIHDAHSSPAERFEAFSKARLIVGDRAYKTADGAYRVCFAENFPEGGCCYCLRHVPKEKPMPMSWCICCAGHIKHHFETTLGVKAECECLSSQLTSCGKEPCLFELKIIGEA
jgi:hypothetical protein